MRRANLLHLTVALAFGAFGALPARADEAPYIGELSSSDSVGTARSSEPIHIHRRNFEVGGNANWVSSGVNYDSVTIAPSILYFAWDRWAIGGTTGLSFGDDGETRSLGPKGVFYFWTREKQAAFIGQSVEYLHYRGPTRRYQVFSTTLATDLGWKFFVTPAVALGPTLLYLRTLQGGESHPRIQLRLAFSIHL